MKLNRTEPVMNRKVKTYLIKAVTLRDPDEVCGVRYK